MTAEHIAGLLADNADLRAEVEGRRADCEKLHGALVSVGSEIAALRAETAQDAAKLAVWAYKQGWEHAISSLSAAAKAINEEQMEVQLAAMVEKKLSACPP